MLRYTGLTEVLMKLRRALAVAAATAVIAPLTLLSAPAAFATGDPSTTTTTEPTTPTSEPTDSTTEPTDPPADDIPTDEPTDDETDPAKPTEEPDPNEPPVDEEVPFCEELDENFADAKVSADLKGLPGKIVAGSGFHGFELVVTNDSKAEIDGVAFYAEVENFEIDESKWLSPYVNLQFKNPESGKWETIRDESGYAGDYFFFVESLKPKASEKVDLRVSIDAKAPAGDAYSFGSGAYLDNIEDQDCIAEGWAQYDFEVLKSGSSNENPGTATPSDKKPKDSVKKPQGAVAELPTGNLAETGSSSALPMIGLAGGVALVAGAGAVFVVRRRKTGADA
ncbi:LAETG motif-containing sortase-dependent surface protein [Streptomyces yerevanensis]|uniref:LAETG motif-containing sortase-dependent surface protein n=1 Tax=Streptomyces yerevanensis TaxID=66378 RepID=UPI000AEE1F42|nr:LAETG motif-containing sortase-dependent surface protein [Streptomyces yerevanensis]